MTRGGEKRREGKVGTGGAGRGRGERAESGEEGGVWKGRLGGEWLSGDVGKGSAEYL